MSLKIKVAFCCFLFPIVLLGAFGVVYLLTPAFMSYHAEAINMPWSELSTELQILILDIMRGTGAGFFSIAIALAILLFIPFRKGEPWSRWAILTVGLSETLLVLYAALSLKFNTHASPPLLGIITAVVLFIIGFVLSHDLKHP